MIAPSADELLAGIARWVEFETHTADVPGVNALMDHVADGYRGVDARVERIPGRDGRGDHLSITSPWGGAGKGVLVLCHLDTVHPRGTLAEFPYRVEGDRAYGPGIYDMKGGAYLAYAAYRSVAAQGGCALPVRLLYTSDEEVGSPTSRTLIEHAADNASHVLVVEPARDGGKIVTSRKGVARYLLEAHGRPAHSGGKHSQGRSAILEVARHVTAIEALTDFARGLTFNIGQIKGGTADNTVPAYCEASIDMRLVTMADGEAMEKHLMSLKPYNPDVRIKVSGQINRPPYETNAGGERLFAHARGLAREIGIELEGCFTGGGSDGNFTAHKVPTLDGLGVDGNGAHTHEEHLLVSSLVPRFTLLRRLMETLR